MTSTRLRAAVTVAALTLATMALITVAAAPAHAEGIDCADYLDAMGEDTQVRLGICFEIAHFSQVVGYWPAWNACVPQMVATGLWWNNIADVACALATVD